MVERDFGKYLKELRMKNGLSLRQLSLCSGVSNAYLSQIETGARSTPKPDILMKISEGLQIPYNQLMAAAGYIDTQISIPVVGAVKAVPNGLAYEELLGSEKMDTEDKAEGNYFYLKVKDDSMINEGILPGDLVLVREQNEIEYGDLTVVIIENEEGTLNKVYKHNDSITLQSANPVYPSRTFTGKEMERIRIVGKIKGLKRKL